MQLGRVGDTFLPSELYEAIERSRKQSTCLGQRIRLSWRWGEFQSNSPLHKRNITYEKDIRNMKSVVAARIQEADAVGCVAPAIPLLGLKPRSYLAGRSV